MPATQVMLDSTTYGVPSGNYDGSSLDWDSDAVRAADYYRGRGGVQTINFDLTGFQGRIKLQGTLNSDSPNANWFDTYDLDSRLTPVTNIVRDRKSTRLNSSHMSESRMPSSA